MERKHQLRAGVGEGGRRGSRMGSIFDLGRRDENGSCHRGGNRERTHLWGAIGDISLAHAKYEQVKTSKWSELV